MHSPLHTRWREAVRERDDKRGTEAAGSVARERGAHGKASGQRPGSGTRVGTSAWYALRGCRGRGDSRFDG